MTSSGVASKARPRPRSVHINLIDPSHPFSTNSPNSSSTSSSPMSRSPSASPSSQIQYGKAYEIYRSPSLPSHSGHLTETGTGNWHAQAIWRGGYRRTLVLIFIGCTLIWWIFGLETTTTNSVKEVAVVENEAMNLERLVSEYFEPNQPNLPICEEALNGGVCKFLLSGIIKEQATKAQEHLHQLGLLAMSLNRTLVLPPIAGSRFSLCAGTAHPFTLHYTLDSLSSLGIKTVTYAEYLRHLTGATRPATAKFVSLAQGFNSDSEVQAEPVTLTPEKFCLDSTDERYDFETIEPSWIEAPPKFYKGSEAEKAETGKIILDKLAAENEADVIITHWTLRYPFLTPNVVGEYNPSLTSALRPFQHFHPAEIWNKVANQLISNLGKFIAIHWRIETLETERLFPCVQSLIEDITQLYSDYPELQSIYLLTDFPLTALDSTTISIRANSDTLTKFLTAEHFTAFKELVDTLRISLPGLRFTFLEPELKTLTESQNLPDPLPNLLNALPTATPSLLDLDTGIGGLLDKLVAEQSDWFLAGESEGSWQVRCAKSSSYTREIIDAREILVAEGKVSNTVDHFSIADL